MDVALLRLECLKLAVDFSRRSPHFSADDVAKLATDFYNHIMQQGGQPAKTVSRPAKR